jgi:hypothetical protein
MIDHVLKALALDRHAEIIHPREIRCCQPTRVVHLSEEHFFRWARKSSPAPHLSLQSPQLSIAEPAWVAALQFAEQGLGLESRFLLQQRAYFRPDLGERVDPCLPVMRLDQVAGKPLSPAKLTCRLLVHVGPHRCYRQRLTRR